ALLSLKQVKDGVRYLRGKTPVPNPSTFREADQLLRNPEFSYLGRTLDGEEQFYQGLVGPDGAESLIFTAKRALEMVHSADPIASYPTFRLTPRLVGALQVMLVAIFAFGSTFPIAVAIMRSKTTQAYEAVFKKLKELGLKPKQVVTDWEVAEREGWRRAFHKVLYLYSDVFTDGSEAVDNSNRCGDGSGEYNMEGGNVAEKNDSAPGPSDKGTAKRKCSTEKPTKPKKALQDRSPWKVTPQKNQQPSWSSCGERADASIMENARLSSRNSSQGQQPPAFSQGQQPTAFSQGQQTPAYSQGQQPPAFSQGQQPPAYSQGQQPPAFSQGQQHPAYSQGQQHPAYSQGQQPPAFSQGQQPPAFSQGQQHPAYSQGQQPPAFSQGQQHPAYPYPPYPIYQGYEYYQPQPAYQYNQYPAQVPTAQKTPGKGASLGSLLLDISNN
ncbi:Transcription elongation factor spt5, partial [Frankliniella fusca]